ncbi:MAG: methyl-accepting chemotaxis protein [Gammaproteobacteria bacterium]|nr:methyl-accepting chemotaxis protein [Gammaproteobacteria bacterium]
MNKISFKPSITRTLLMASVVFWIVAGFVFPVFAELYMSWQPGILVWGVICIVLGAALGFTNYLMVDVILLQKLKVISIMAQAMSENDINQHCDLKSDDLIGEIADGFNHMADNLRNIVGEISGATSQLASAAEEMSAITDEAGNSVAHQQSEIEHVATSMNEMMSTVHEVAKHATEAAASAQQADAAASSGALVAVNAMGGIDALANQVEEAAQVIHKLEQESESIGMVLDVIRGIAEQTNLLALNAAIEAARAGEQGRGFAVVADEVRTLASRTQASTEEIQKMIQRLQIGAGNAVQVMDAARTSAKDGMEQVEQAAEALGEIAGEVAAITDMNTQIASAAEEQSAVTEEINQNVANIKEVADQTSAGAQQTASASAELARLSAQLQSLMGQFKM